MGFSRTALHNLERAGVARSVAMELIGHKTGSVYQRYDIVAERDLADGVARYAARLATSSNPLDGKEKHRTMPIIAGSEV